MNKQNERTNGRNKEGSGARANEKMNYKDETKRMEEHERISWQGIMTSRRREKFI